MENNFQQPIIETLSAYLDGELSPQEAAKLEAYLDQDDEARQLLLQLQQISGMVSNLPTEKAPINVAENILFEVERDQLLGHSPGLTEIKGAKQLRFRRLIAAASLIFLLGGIGTITYKVLDNPNSNSNNTVEPTVAIAPPTVQPETPVPIAIEPDVTETPEPATITVVKANKPLPKPQLGHIELEILDNTLLSKETIEATLAKEEIKNYMPILIDETIEQYAFLCTASQLGSIYDSLNSIDDNKIHLVLNNEQDQRTIKLQKINQQQLLALASITNSEMQFQTASGLGDHIYHEPITEEPTSLMASHSLIESSDTMTNLPDWLNEFMANEEPAFAELQLLGPAIIPESPEKTSQPTATPLIANVPISEQPETDVEALTHDEPDTTANVSIELDTSAIDPDQKIAVILTYKSARVIEKASPQIEIIPEEVKAVELTPNIPILPAN